MLNSKLSLVLAISLAIGVTGCSTLKKSTTTPTGSEQTSNQSQAEKDKQAAEAQAAALAEQERLKAEALANANKNQGKNANGQNATGQNTDNGSDANNDSSNQADLLSTRLVHFDYDSSDLNGDDLKILQAHANYLSQNPQAKVLLSGHADERGTREYNMALGERRANAVQAFLSSNGVRGGQLDTVSYGKEKPINDGHDEAAWAENRRVEITYKANAPK